VRCDVTAALTCSSVFSYFSNLLIYFRRDDSIYMYFLLYIAYSPSICRSRYYRWSSFSTWVSFTLFLSEVISKLSSSYSLLNSATAFLFSAFNFWISVVNYFSRSFCYSYLSDSAVSSSIILRKSENERLSPFISLMTFSIVSMSFSLCLWTWV